MNPFFGTRGNKEGRIMIVGESWGRQENIRKTCFVGETGQDLERLLNEASIPINECFFTNVISEHPDDNDMKKFFFPTRQAREIDAIYYKGLFPRENIFNGLRNLKEQILAIKPKLIIGLGNYALWALSDSSFSIGDDAGYKVPTGIGQWRGSQIYTSHEMGNIPFLPTYHPAAALQGVYAWRYMIKHDFATRIKLALNDDWKEPDYDFIIQPSFETITGYLSSLLIKLNREQTNVVLDLETSRTRSLISCVGLSYKPGTAICIPFICSYREEGYFSQIEEYEIVQLLRQILSHPNLNLIGHNLLFDCQYIVDQLFVKPRVFHDTMIGQHVLWPGGGDPNDPDSEKNLGQGIQRKALYNCASLYCHHYYFWKDEGKDFGDNTGRDELIGWSYNCRDVIKTFEIFEAEQQLLKHFDLTEQFSFQMRTLNDFALPMMIKGIKVNEETKATINKELSEAMSRFDAGLTELIPIEIRRAIEPSTSKKNPKTGIKEKTPWFTSTTQQKKIFHDFMGIAPVYSKAKTKNQPKKVTLNKEALPILAQREPIIASLVGQLETRRSISVYANTFGETRIEPDGRMRCSYNVTGTDTFRFSSSQNIYERGGNLQNIPSGKEDDEGDFNFPNMRRHFEPDLGYEIAEFDQSGADATIVAWEADDEELKRAFREGKKIHLVNTRALFEHETRNMTDEEIKQGSGIPGSYYDSVKKGCHATNYGAQAPTLAYKLKWTLSKSEEFQERWFFKHPGIREWHKRTELQLSGLKCWKCDAFTNGRTICSQCNVATGRTVSNKFGYRIVYFDRIGNLLKKALAWKPQSSVAINCNKSAIAMLDQCPWVTPLLQVHDSIVVQYPISKHDDLPFIKKALHSISVPYDDPLTIQWNCKISRNNWGECASIPSW